MIARAMASPMPVPLPFAAALFAAIELLERSAADPTGSIPGPLSSTANSTRSSDAPAAQHNAAARRANTAQHSRAGAATPAQADCGSNHAGLSGSSTAIASPDASPAQPATPPPPAPAARAYAAAPACTCTTLASISAISTASPISASSRAALFVHNRRQIQPRRIVQPSALQQRCRCRANRGQRRPQFMGQRIDQRSAQPLALARCLQRADASIAMARASAIATCALTAVATSRDSVCRPPRQRAHLRASPASAASPAISSGATICRAACPASSRAGSPRMAHRQLGARDA